MLLYANMQGALTSRKHAFRARAWDLRSRWMSIWGYIGITKLKIDAVENNIYRIQSGNKNRVNWIKNQIRFARICQWELKKDKGFIFFVDLVFAMYNVTIKDLNHKESFEQVKGLQTSTICKPFSEVDNKDYLDIFFELTNPLYLFLKKRKIELYPYIVSRFDREDEGGWLDEEFQLIPGYQFDHGDGSSKINPYYAPENENTDVNTGNDDSFEYYSGMEEEDSFETCYFEGAYHHPFGTDSKYHSLINDLYVSSSNDYLDDMESNEEFDFLEPELFSAQPYFSMRKKKPFAIQINKKPKISKKTKINKKKLKKMLKANAKKVPFPSSMVSRTDQLFSGLSLIRYLTPNLIFFSPFHLSNILLHCFNIRTIISPSNLFVLKPKLAHRIKSNFYYN